jgi:hypothetical protein
LDWEAWIRPYVERRVFGRRKNQYSAEMTESVCYSIVSVPFKLMAKHRAKRHLKWKIAGVCKKCSSEFVSSWNNMWLRKAFKGQEICGRCARKEQFTDEWRRHNSEAQRRAQGTPQAKRRMSETLKKSWIKDPTIRTRISQSLLKTYDGNDDLRRKIGDASRRNWKKAEYQEKVTGKGYHHGWFISRCGRIYFASSWELMFLMWCDEHLEVKTFGRSGDSIPYDKPMGGVAHYHPDFEIETKTDKTVVEVKGGKSDFDLVERKRMAAERFYNGASTYVIIYRDDLKRMGIFRENRTVAQWIGQLVVSGKVQGYDFGKKHS